MFCLGSEIRIYLHTHVIFSMSISQVPKLFGIYHLLVSYFHNIHHPTQALLGCYYAIWNPISQVPKLFWIYHLLGFIRCTLDHNFYVVVYVRQVPFFHNIPHPSSNPGSVTIGNIWNSISQVPKLFGVYHLYRSIQERGGLEQVFCSLISHVCATSSLTIFC